MCVNVTVQVIFWSVLIAKNLRSMYLTKTHILHIIIYIISILKRRSSLYDYLFRTARMHNYFKLNTGKSWVRYCFDDPPIVLNYFQNQLEHLFHSMSGIRLSASSTLENEIGQTCRLMSFCFTIPPPNNMTGPYTE